MRLTIEKIGDDFRATVDEIQAVETELEAMRQLAILSPIQVNALLAVRRVFGTAERFRLVLEL